MAEEKLFVRKATGLVREIGAITAIIIVMANTIGLGWQKRVFQYTGLAPLPENQYWAGIPPMTMAFIVGGIAVLLSVLAVCSRGCNASFRGRIRRDFQNHWAGLGVSGRLA